MSAAVLESEATSCPAPGHRAPTPPPPERPRPLDPEAPAAGRGRLEVAAVDGASSVVACRACSPLRVLTPRPRGRAVWTVLATLGGGLVAGDAIDLDVEVGPGAAALIGTQSEAKVYRSGTRWTSHRLRASVSSGATLALLPEPTSCFAGARYRQEQAFQLERDASLLLVDALAAGRVARHERWAFDAYLSRNTVSVGGRLVLADAVRLVRGEGPPPDRVMNGIELLATVVAVGPDVAPRARRVLEDVARQPADAAADVLVSASALAGGVYLRLAARTLEPGLAFIRERLAFVGEILGGNPFERRP